MSFMIGENVGHFRILGQLGQGGMATVYHAYDANLDRDVAIKVMHQAFKEDPNFFVRFRREAQIVARLRHPHIVSVYEFDEHQGQPYLVMEFVEGQTLKAYLSRQSLTLAQTIRIMAAVGEALTYAHEQGVLHRDIKPSNILLDAKETPYLTDFGLARMVQAGESTLSQDMILGTPQYISPEQAKGSKDLGPATDVYSLGIVLYQLIVGRVPFSADTPYAIIHDHIYKPLPLPRHVNPNVPSAVERVLLKALAKEPADRFTTVNDMIAAFQQAVEATGMAALPARRAVPPPPTPKEGAAASPASPAIPAVLPSVSSILDTATQRKYRRRRNLWMLGGLGAFIFTCLCGLLIAVAAIANPSLTLITPIPVTAPPQNPTQTQESTVEIPTGLSVEEARQLVATSPDDPVAYLALALAQLERGERLEAQRTLNQALALAQDDPALIVAAARQAAQLGYPLEALLLYQEAYSLGGMDNLNLRNEMGAYMYNLAINADLRTLPILRRAAEGAPNVAGFQAMYARALIAVGNLDEAGEMLDQALNLDGGLAETHLVRGEWYAANGQMAEAREEWRYVTTSADSAPPWVAERASELLAASGAS